jgi:hypothetical protein
MFGLAPWRSSDARALAPNFGLLPPCFDRVAPTQHAVPAGIRRDFAALRRSGGLTPNP